MQFRHILSLYQTVNNKVAIAPSARYFQKSAFTRRRVGSCTLIVAVLTCGAFIWLEVSVIGRKLSAVTNVFDVEKTGQPYIYLWDIRQKLTLRSKTENIKLKYLNPDCIRKEPWFPWLQSRSQDPWTLLKLTCSEDKAVRQLGVYSLANIEDWEDYQYRYIAQASDWRTQVGLARCQDVDSRFFLPPPRLLPTKMQSTELELRRLLSSLPTEGEFDRCVQHFTSVALQKGQILEDENGLYFENSSLESSQVSSLIKDRKRVTYYLEALASHSTNPLHCQQICYNGGLQLMFRLTQNSAGYQSIDQHQLIARILGNLALNQNLQRDIVRAGWLTVLTRWIQSSDLSLSLLASRALQNLDADFTSHVCEDGVFVIHPKYRTNEVSEADVVFVHGIMGGPFKTWRQQDHMQRQNNEQGFDNEKQPKQSMCWPKEWLSTDCPGLRILSVEYDTHVSEWYIRCPFDSDKRTVAVRGLSLLEKLHKAGIGSRPIIWVGHSMGGLLVKQMLSLAESNPKFVGVVRNTCGVVFYSVPHEGLTLADRSNQARFLLYPSVEVQELSKDSVKLKMLHENFKLFVITNRVKVLSFGETEKMSLGKTLPKVLVVPPESSDPGVGDFVLFPANHINICKPRDKDSQLYALTLKFIRNCLLQNRVQKFIKTGIAFEEVAS